MERGSSGDSGGPTESERKSESLLESVEEESWFAWTLGTGKSIKKITLRRCSDIRGTPLQVLVEQVTTLGHVPRSGTCFICE